MLDFTEIPGAGGGPNRDRFELFAREFLRLLAFEIVEGPNRGADGGADLIVREKRSGAGGETTIKWLVSCKHKATSGRSVSGKDEVNILERLEQHQCEGFMGFYSTIVSSGLQEILMGLKGKREILVFDPARIERHLAESDEMRALASRFFPKSTNAIETAEHAAEQNFTLVPPDIGTNWKPDPSFVDEQEGYYFVGDFDLKVKEACSILRLEFDVVRNDNYAWCEIPGRKPNAAMGEPLAAGYFLLAGYKRYLDGNGLLQEIVPLQKDQHVRLAISSRCRATDRFAPDKVSSSIYYWTDAPTQIVTIEYECCGCRYRESHLFHFPVHRMELKSVEVKKLT
ncbi:UNVERIFIED_ORG: hypothetical protein GGI57_005275 [Rhizobium aethiopicum]